MSAKTPGQRLETYLRKKVGTRSRTALATATGISRQQLTQWFEDKGEPRMSALAAAAFRIGVRRIDLVAAYDGVTPPETKKEPPPDWAAAIMTRDEVQKLVSEVEGRVTATIEGGVTARADAIVDHVVDRMVAELLKRAPQPVAADVQPQSD